MDEQQRFMLYAQQQQQNVFQRAFYSSMTYLAVGTNALYSGMGQLYPDPYGYHGTFQTQLGTPALAPPAPLDPDEIAWLKGRVNEILWKPQKFPSGGRAL